jgi:glutaredoxin
MKIEQETKDWRLYQLVACPFCVKVRRELVRLGLDLRVFDIKDPKFHAELMAGGKIDQVPCLMIPSSTGGEVKWIYESDEIISFLQTRFR